MLAFLPLLLAVQLLLTVGLALPLTVLNVHLRDVDQILANGLVLPFFLSSILRSSPWQCSGPALDLRPAPGSGSSGISNPTVEAIARQLTFQYEVDLV